MKIQSGLSYYILDFGLYQGCNCPLFLNSKKNNSAFPRYECSRYEVRKPKTSPFWESNEGKGIIWGVPIGDSLSLARLDCSGDVTKMVYFSTSHLDQYTRAAIQLSYGCVKFGSDRIEISSYNWLARNKPSVLSPPHLHTQMWSSSLYLPPRLLNDSLICCVCIIFWTLCTEASSKGHNKTTTTTTTPKGAFATPPV